QPEQANNHNPKAGRSLPEHSNSGSARGPVQPQMTRATGVLEDVAARNGVHVFSGLEGLEPVGDLAQRVGPRIDRPPVQSVGRLVPTETQLSGLDLGVAGSCVNP